MGRRLADTNPALIEPDCDALKVKSKRPRLSSIESTAMAALLSFRKEPRSTANVEANMQKHTVAMKTLVDKKQDGDSDATNVTDDEESICSHQSQLVMPSLPTRSLITGGSPPPLNKALVKPMLPSFKKQLKVLPMMMPQGRPLPPAPGLAKHLVKQTRPICLKLSP
mmetsp:Transcript_14827/g.28244  ORF Transcript_14827/g.28244 Transcript_14827/m.28244 type:complete len:167 (+) Transcript_14827:127-627(+)|eukprot:scaffold223_cov145-Amphora_coffeaeformis.AAC.8